MSALLSACTSYHGSLTNLGPVDQFPAGRWAPTASGNGVQIGVGVYYLPTDHLILVHIQIPDARRTSLGPGAVRGAVGVWWVALDDRVPQDGTPVWLPGCVRFKTGARGAAFDVAGAHLDGPAAASLSRYPLSFNPEDGSVSVALSPADEIAVPRSGQGLPYLPPSDAACSASS